jgi:DNA-binding transcriptional MerR regulator
MSIGQPPIVFTDGKAQDALRTIGEVSAALGIKQHVLRYWEDQFPMLRPLKRSGGRRYYRPEDIQLIAAIDRMVHRDGYTLRGARLAVEGSVPESPDFQTARQEFEGSAAVAQSIVPQLKAIRDSLAAALNVG